MLGSGVNRTLNLVSGLRKPLQVYANLTFGVLCDEYGGIDDN